MNPNSLANTRTATAVGLASQTTLGQFGETLTGKVTFAVAASAFVAVCAHVSVPLPFTPVPLTLGNMAVVLVGLMLGPATAFGALALYLLEGALGMPVFNPGGPGGIAQMLGPTGGYLLAYPLAAALASLVRRSIGSLRLPFLAALSGAGLGTLLVLASGVTWLAFFAHLSARQAFVAGLAPFLPGEVVKIAAAAGIARAFVRRQSI